MTHPKRTTLLSVAMLGAAMWLLSTSNATSTASKPPSDPWGRYATTPVTSVLSGSRINVALGRYISSETAHVGDEWHGTVTEYVMTENDCVIPPGSEVEGVVTGVTAAEHGLPAVLELAVRHIRVNGHDEPIPASSDPVIGGSARAHELGAIGGEASADESLGDVTDDADATVAGAPLGGTPVVGVVARSKGNQLVLSDGTVISFTTNQTVAMR